jgi:hypothetical protein
MKNNKIEKKLFRYGLWGLVGLAATQIYLVREIFFAWLMFFLAFCVITGGLLLIVALFEAARAVLDWVAPKIPAARPASSPRLVRSH